MPVVQVQKGYLSLEKKLAEGTIADQDKEFEFSISIPEAHAGNYNALYSDGRSTEVNFTVQQDTGNAVASVQLKADETLIIALPDGIEATVTENTDGYTAEWICERGTVTDGGVTVEIDKSSRVEIICTNTEIPATGNLSLSKVVTGIDDSDNSLATQAIFTFKISKLNDDNTVDTTYNDETLGFVNGVKTVEVHGQSTVPISNLLAGNYSISEVTYPQSLGEEYVFVEKSGEGTVAVEKDATANATVTNIYEHRDKTLTITKKVDGNMGDRTRDFEFELTVLDENGNLLNEAEYQQIAGTAEKNGVALGLAFGDQGKATFTLQNNHTFTITIPHGYHYTVEEVNNNGYEVKIEVTGSGTAENGQLKGNLTADTSATFTNTRNINPPTGLIHSSTPFAAMIIIALGALIVFITGRRIRR